MSLTNSLRLSQTNSTLLEPKVLLAAGDQDAAAAGAAEFFAGLSAEEAAAVVNGGQPAPASTTSPAPAPAQPPTSASPAVQTNGGGGSASPVAGSGESQAAPPSSAASGSESNFVSVDLPGGATNDRVVPSSAPVSQTEDFDGYYRSGPLRRGPEYYAGDPLSAFKQGPLAGQSPGLLHNPYKLNGDAAPPYFNGVETGYFTEGPYWSTGDGNTALGQQGGAYYANSSDVNFLVAGGLIPGNEQPGQALTPVKVGASDIQALRPPVENSGFRNGGQPEIYTSVGNLDPTDGIGWRYSDTFPGGDSTESDFGTPQYAYKYDVIGDNGSIFAGLATNEGYDPELGQNVGYGTALYARGGDGSKGDLLGVVYTTPGGRGVAQSRLVGRTYSNPQVNPNSVSLQVGQGQIGGREFLYEAVNPEVAEQLISQYSSDPEFKLVTYNY